jgi:DNA-binding CsgD family transcriptional regulator
VRTALASDAAAFAAWIARDFPLPSLLAPALAALLARLIAEEALTATLVEDLAHASAQSVIVAFGLSGFISDASARRYLAAPYPCLEIDVLDRAWRGRSPLLGHDEIARANAAEGLTLFPLMWLQRSDDPSDPEARALLTICQQTFLRVHRGYRLSRILKEAPASRAEAFTQGGFRERCRLPAGTPLRIAGRRLDCEHVVFEITRAEIEATLPGHAVGHLFDYRPPRCGFTRAEKRVLTRAADGLTDAQIARQLGISTPAVALRWRSIYARIAERAPSALQESVALPGTRGRGQEKRRRVIAFLSDHPEEMRPYLAS